MSLNPLNELKRRLDDNNTPLPKRLCLAKNVIQSHHFPSAPKERIVADWLHALTLKNELSSDDFKNVIGWLNFTHDLTGEMKSKLVQIVALYLKRNLLQSSDVQNLLSFLENPKLTSQFCVHIEECLQIAVSILQFIKCETLNIQLYQRVFNNIIKFYKESKKKLEFIMKFLEGENLETVLSYLDVDRATVINVCGNILFPMSKKSFFASYLQTLVRKDSIDGLLVEKGDNIQSVLKIMDAIFRFPSGRTVTEDSFLSDFIDVFVCCYKGESQLIFAFFVMLTNCLRMEQNYVSPATTMDPIIFNDNSEKIKRNMFLRMLEIVNKHEVDINVRLSDTLGEKIPKVETKKTFVLFLEAVMMGQLKTRKPDKTTFQILKTILKLDPSLVEMKMKEILPDLMIAKKSQNVLQSYSEMLNCLLETQFRLSRGTIFLDEMLPLINSSLEASNTELEDLKSNVKFATENAQDCEKIKSKILYAEDVFPDETVQLYGRLTSELMFRQNKDLLLSLQKNFEELGLNNINSQKCSASTAIMIEVMSSILSSFFRHCKMADHTVPANIADEFWAVFHSFETNGLNKLGEYVLSVENDPQILVAFLKLCLSLSQLKLLNIKYSHNKLKVPEDISSEVFNLSFLLPCLTNDQWNSLASKVDSDGATLLLNEILIIKSMMIKTLSIRNNLNMEALATTKTYIIKQLSNIPQMLDQNNYTSCVLLADLENKQHKDVSKTIVKQCLKDSTTEILKNEAILNNKSLLNTVLIDTVKNIIKCFENTNDLEKPFKKSELDFIVFCKENDMKKCFRELSVIEGNDDSLTVYVDILKELKIYYLEENYQLAALYVLLAIKKCCGKKLRRSVDYVLQSIFELSPQPPDMYKIFPVNFIFSFKDKVLIDLLTLKIKTSNNFLVIKCLVESAVKRVKVESEIVKNIVDLLLTNHSKCNSTSIEFFSDPAFQISCIILPLIVKQKKAITLSAYRSILADLQEKLHKSLLDCFKNINFIENSSLNITTSSNINESVVVSESTMATLNALSAYSLTLSKYCESNDEDSNRNLEYLWPGLEYFVQTAVQSLQNPDSKYHHIESSLQLLNAVLRYIKRLETHRIFQNRDKLFIEIWNSVKARLTVVLDENVKKKFHNNACLDDIAVTVKFLCEWVTVEGFNKHFVGDLGTLASIELPPKSKEDSQTKTLLTSHKVAKFLWANILKANIVGPKCVALSKLMYQNSRNLKTYIQQHYEVEQTGVVIKSKKKKLTVEYQMEQKDEVELKAFKMDDGICEVVKIGLETLSEAILAAKKINLDYKFLDSIFELQHLVHYTLGRNSLRTRCEVSWQSFFILFESSVAVLNSLLVSREELLEDRWPCYMQCYRALVSCLCSKSSTQEEFERSIEERLGLLAHSIEKLTQSICRRKTHVSRIAAYTVGDICASLEKSVPSRNVRQHLENSIALLIQAADTTHAMAFLRRALVNTAGQMTMTNMYTMYKRYHKYVGNA